MKNGAGFRNVSNLISPNHSIQVIELHLRRNSEFLGIAATRYLARRMTMNDDGDDFYDSFFARGLNKIFRTHEPSSVGTIASIVAKKTEIHCYTRTVSYDSRFSSSRRGFFTLHFPCFVRKLAKETLWNRAAWQWYYLTRRYYIFTRFSFVWSSGFRDKDLNFIKVYGSFDAIGL